MNYVYVLHTHYNVDLISVKVDGFARGKTATNNLHSSLYGSQISSLVYFVDVNVVDNSPLLRDAAD